MATPDPLSLAGFSDEQVTTRAEMTGGSPFFLPISMAFLPDNRMLLLSKDGEIRIVDPESGRSEVYMQLPNIDTGEERGLLDITLDPDFANNGYFYLFYTPDSPENARIARFQHTENSGGLTSTGDVSSEFVVWEDTDGYLACCHYGGGLDFGVDGKIWLTTSDKFQATTPGEGASGGIDLPVMLNSSSGKIIRVNSDGTIPDGTDGWAANPFIDGVGGNDDSVWAYGLRNPFRARWDAEYGHFYIAEVGGNQQLLAHEDLHIAGLDQRGAFYGWPYYEGTTDTVVNTSPDRLNYPVADGDIANEAEGDFYSSPIWSLYHNGTGASITGGEVYRGDMFPEEWDGVYFYGDYTRDYIRYLILDETGTQVLGDYAFKPSSAFPGKTNEVVSITVGADGALYYAMIASGEIRRVTYGDNDAPDITSESVTPLTGDLPLTIQFNATVVDLDGDTMTYVLNFGDGTVLTGNVGANGVISFDHAYEDVGRYYVSLSVSDGFKTTYSYGYVIEAGDVNDAPTVANESANLSFASTADPITFTATLGDLDGDTLHYTWRFGDGTSVSGTAPAGTVVTATHTYATEGSFTAVLEVSDGTNTVFSDGVRIQVGTPTEVPVTNGLVLLLESDIKIGLGEGDRVTAWLDGSGNGNNLFATGDPRLVENVTATGKPAIIFDGFNDTLRRDAAVDGLFNLPSGNQNRTVFFVVDYEATNGRSAGVVWGDDGLDKAFGLVADGQTGNVAVQGWGTAHDVVTNVNAVTGGFFVQSATLSAGVLSQYRNGVLINTDQETFNTTIQSLILGGNIGNLGNSAMKIAAVLIYDRALSASERAQVESFLQTKYVGDGTANLPPTAENDTASVIVDNSVFIDVLGNDSDLDGNPLSIISVTPPAHGTVTIDNNGTPTDTTDDRILYVPNAGFQGTDTFSYTISDGRGGTDSGAVTVSVIAPSNIPVTNGLVAAFEADQNVSTGAGNTVAGWLDGSGRGNDLVAKGNPQLLANATPTGQSAIAFDGVGDLLQRDGAVDTLNGLPAGAGNRTMYFVVRYVDAEGVSAGLVYGDKESNQAFGLVSNWSDNDLTVQGYGSKNDFDSNVDGPTSGWIVQSVVLSNNQYQHFLNGNLIGSGAHTFNTDLQKLIIGAEIGAKGESKLEVAAALIYNRALSTAERNDLTAYLMQKYIVAAGNDAPIAKDDTFQFIEDQPLFGNVLNNNGNGVDSDPDGDALTVSLVSNVTNGTVTLNPNGTFTFTPSANFNGTAQFTYRLSDGKGGTDDATVTLVGTPVNDPAVAVDDNYSTGAGTQLVVGATSGVLQNDTDVENDPIQATLLTSVSHGTLAFQSNGAFTYTPNAGFVGNDVFTYAVTGGDTATVTISVGVPEPVLTVTSGLVARFESDAGLSANGSGLVSGWADLSGRGNNLFGAGDPALLLGATPTGENAIHFDGTGDLLQRVNSTNPLSGLPSGSEDRTLFFVVDYLNTNNFHSGMIYGDGALNEAFGLVTDRKRGSLELQGWGNLNDFDSRVAGVSDGFIVQSVVLKDDAFTHYKNGVLIGSGQHVFATDLQRLIFGSEVDLRGQSEMAVAAGLIYDRALSESERSFVETYLQQKYIDDDFAFV